MGASSAILEEHEGLRGDAPPRLSATGLFTTSIAVPLTLAIERGMMYVMRPSFLSLVPCGTGGACEKSLLMAGRLKTARFIV
jgi:hypothetical protein